MACRRPARTCAALQRRDVPNRPKPIAALLTFLPSASSHPPQACHCPTPDCRTESQPSSQHSQRNQQPSNPATQNSDYWTGLPFWDSWPVPRTGTIQLKYPPILLPRISPRFLSSMLNTPLYSSCLHNSFHKDPRHLSRFFVKTTIRHIHQLSYPVQQHKPQQQLVSC